MAVSDAFDGNPTMDPRTRRVVLRAARSSSWDPLLLPGQAATSCAKNSPSWICLPMYFSSCAQGISYCFLDIFSMCSQYTSQWVLNLILKRVLDIYLNVFTLHFLKVIHQSPFLRRFDPFLLQLEAFYSNQNLSHLLLCVQFPFVC